MKDEEKDTYCYHLIRNGEIILSGITYDISRREAEHMLHHPGATIKQVGRKVTWKEALKWELRQSKS